MEPVVSKKYCHYCKYLVISYIIFKTRISFKEHMKSGGHLLAPGTAGVKGRFVREFMLLLDVISVREQITRER